MISYYVSSFLLTIYVMLKNRCNLIHVHWAIPTGLIGVWAGKLLRKPVVITIHGSDFRMATEGSIFVKKIFLYVCQRAKQIMCVSKLQEKEIERMGISKERMLTFPMGIDESFLETGRDREEKLDGRPHTVMSNRNLLPLYNVSLLIQAIPSVIKEEPHTKFFIAGDGQEKGKLQREAENLRVSSFVQFLGRVPHEKMADLLAQTDIYVSTSLHDGTSVSLLEAMGAGAFPVVADIPANREWITNGENGFLFSADEAVSLASKIIDAIRNRELLQRSRTKNRLIVGQKALWSECIKRVENIYTNISIP